jgi:hypothetical protein
MRKSKAFRPSLLDPLEERVVPSSFSLQRAVTPPHVITNVFRSEHKGHHSAWGNFIRKVDASFNENIVKQINHAYHRMHHNHQDHAVRATSNQNNAADQAVH